MWQKSREDARLETVEAMVDVYKKRMLYSDEELEGHLWSKRREVWHVQKGI